MHKLNSLFSDDLVTNEAELIACCVSFHFSLFVSVFRLDNLHINTCVEYPIADGNDYHKVVQLTLCRLGRTAHMSMVHGRRIIAWVREREEAKKEYENLRENVLKLIKPAKRHSATHTHTHTRTQVITTHANERLLSPLCNLCRLPYKLWAQLPFRPTLFPCMWFSVYGLTLMAVCVCVCGWELCECAGIFNPHACGSVIFINYFYCSLCFLFSCLLLCSTW